MVVGYALGNSNDKENDIQVLGEDRDNVLAYSKATSVVLSRMCRNNCPYCSFHRKDNIVVPYSTIKIARDARLSGAREAVYVAGERPDKYSQVRATLDLWGFDTYSDYVYTICELGFLEGLIPVIELGFLSPDEIKKLAQTCALSKIMLDTVDQRNFSNIYPESPGKKMDLRLKQIEWSSKLKLPVVTGLLVGIGESKTHRKQMIDKIRDLHNEFGMIHEFVIQNFVPQDGTKFHNHSVADEKLMIETTEYALDSFKGAVKVIVPFESNPNYEPFLKLGIRDLGRLYEGCSASYVCKDKPRDMTIEQLAEKYGLELQQRFPLRRDFIQQGKYSKKLGQVFDGYRYKIKKETQEKLKKEK
ncbi:7,8-didemethyl-8-hydroxy-5-deazariboflavin synthase subunit CofG [bacterium]|jgi:7,8-didemethyl-8-hydroxy-5-deazariboflavin synthase|nr:7,8-didemethyl-8-hydroxy-5-deazariboflavin synthase subunit CofG [bacterium]